MSTCNAVGKIHSGRRTLETHENLPARTAHTPCAPSPAHRSTQALGRGMHVYCKACSCSGRSFWTNVHCQVEPEDRAVSGSDQGKGRISYCWQRQACLHSTRGLFPGGGAVDRVMGAALQTIPAQLPTQEACRFSWGSPSHRRANPTRTGGGTSLSPRTWWLLYKKTEGQCVVPKHPLHCRCLQGATLASVSSPFAGSRPNGKMYSHGSLTT